MTSLVTFLGIRREVGNATIARAFFADASESNACLLIEADRVSDTTSDWAERRKKTRTYPHLIVRTSTVEDFLRSDHGDEIVILQAVYCDEETALKLARASRLFVVVLTPDDRDVADVERLLKYLNEEDITLEDIVAVVCCPKPTDDDETSMASALGKIAHVGAQSVGVPFLGRHAAGPLKEMGWTINEGNRSSPRTEEMIRFLQSVFADKD